MLHPELEKTKEQGYPAIRSILHSNYGNQADGIEGARITAVDLGAKSYGFIVNLPQNSTATEKNLFLKVEIPNSASKTKASAAKEEKTREMTFDFMEFSHDKMAVPKVLRDKAGNFVPHIPINPAGVNIPQNLQGSELILMTQAKGQAVPFSKDGEQKLAQFIAKKPGKNTVKLLHNDANYDNHNISQMVSTIADMHKVGEKYLETHDVPISPTHGIRSYNEVYLDINSSLGFNPIELTDEEIVPKANELKVFMMQKASVALRAAAINLSNNSNLGESISEAKDSFKLLLSDKSKVQFNGKGKELPFTIGLEKTIRSKTLSEGQIKLGRQIQQADELYNFASGDKILETINMARNISEIYKGVDKLPQTVLHNDTNPTNFLLDQKDGEMAIIDFDTLGKGPRLGDVMLWHAGRDDSQQDRPEVTKTSIGIYDEKMRITAKEARFAPQLNAALTFDKYVEILKTYSNTDNMNDMEHLNSLNWGIDMALSNAKLWNGAVKTDLAKATQDVRADALSALDLAINTDQTTKKFPPIRTSKGIEFTSSDRMQEALASKNTPASLVESTRRDRTPLKRKACWVDEAKEWEDKSDQRTR